MMRAFAVLSLLCLTLFSGCIAQPSSEIRPPTAAQPANFSLPQNATAPSFLTANETAPASSPSQLLPASKLVSWASERSVRAGAAYGSGAALIGGRLFVFAGRNSSGDRTEVESSAILPNGQPGEWQAGPSLNLARKSFAVAASGTHVYVMGGFGGEITDSVESAGLNADGSMSVWQAENSLPIKTEHPAAALAAGRVYVLGGFSPSGASAKVFSAQIPPDGSLGNWLEENAMKQCSGALGVVNANGRIYALGGAGACSESAAVQEDGRIGEWRAETPLSTSRTYHACAMAGQRIYCMGGAYSDASVESSELGLDGALGQWRAEPSLHTGRYGFAAASDGTLMYVVGGASGSELLGSIERAVFE